MKTQVIKKRAELYKALFNAARYAVHHNFKSDESAVRIARDEKCQEMYGKPYDRLTDEELQNVIDELREDTGFRPHQERFASRDQLKELRYHALACALVYANFDDFTHVDRETGEMFTGESARAVARAQFNEKQYVQPNIYRFLHEEWINPKSNEFMVQGGFKKFYKSPDRFYYEKLRPQAASYLIQRYLQIHNTLNKTTNKITGIHEQINN